MVDCIFGLHSLHEFLVWCICLFFIFGQVLTAVAFSLFAQESVDIAVIEVDFLVTHIVVFIFFIMPLLFLTN